MTQKVECDGGPHCQAAEHIEGCFATTRRHAQRSHDLSTITVTERERRILVSSVMLNVSVQEALGEDPHAVERCLKLHARIVEGLPDED